MSIVKSIKRIEKPGLFDLFYGLAGICEKPSCGLAYAGILRDKNKLIALHGHKMLSVELNDEGVAQIDEYIKHNELVHIKKCNQSEITFVQAPKETRIPAYQMCWPDLDKYTKKVLNVKNRCPDLLKAAFLVSVDNMLCPDYVERFPNFIETFDVYGQGAWRSRPFALPANKIISSIITSAMLVVMPLQFDMEVLDHKKEVQA